VKLSEAQAAIAAGFSLTNASEADSFLVSPRAPFMLEPAHSVPQLKMFSTKVQAAFTTRHVELHMRTFIATMYGVAKEEVYWKEFIHEFPTNWTGYVSYFTNNPGGIIGIKKAESSVAKTNDIIRPIVTLAEFSPQQRQRLTTLIELWYHDRKYTVGDVEDDGPPSVSNRSIFSLLSYLFAQLAIDPQKLPVQQLIQVR